jgi:hypothetical protein
MINEKKNNSPQTDEKRTAHPYWGLGIHPDDSDSSPTMLG